MQTLLRTELQLRDLDFRAAASPRIFYNSTFVFNEKLYFAASV